MHIPRVTILAKTSLDMSGLGNYERSWAYTLGMQQFKAAGSSIESMTYSFRRLSRFLHI